MPEIVLPAAVLFALASLGHFVLGRGCVIGSTLPDLTNRQTAQLLLAALPEVNHPTREEHGRDI